MSTKGRSPQGRFLKGHSGNRKGRPAQQAKVEPLLPHILNEKVTMKIRGKLRKVSKLEALQRIYIDESIRSKKIDYRALCLLVTASQENFELEQGDQEEWLALVRGSRS